MAMLFVRDRLTRKIIYVEENFSSLVWTERYQEYGDFELEIPLNAANLDVYQRGNYISFDESEESMIINCIDFTESYGTEADEEPVLKIKGYSLTSILTQRTASSRIGELLDSRDFTSDDSEEYNDNLIIRYQGKPSELFSTIAQDEMINPLDTRFVWKHYDTSVENPSWQEGLNLNVPGGILNNKVFYERVSNPSRKIDDLIFQNLIYDERDTEIDLGYSKILSVYELFQNLAKRSHTGFRVIFDANDNFVLQVYSGKDRRSTVDTLDPVVFDPTLDNITYINYYEDDYDYKTTSFVYTDAYITYYPKAGNTSDIFEGYCWAEDLTKTGLDRYEVPIDVRDDASIMSAGKDESDELQPPDGGAYIQARWMHYYQQLERRVKTTGEQKFDEGEYNIVNTSEGAIDPLTQYQYGVDYFMGDFVDITSSYNVVMSAMIDEVVRSYDSEGVITTPNFENLLDYDYGEDDDEDDDGNNDGASNN